ncbi:MAG: hypothetical protein O2960_19290 [Verrucomicrobia bacterium]|nr:hypothetical protein [Verrucomicrobiota bacterium]
MRFTVIGPSPAAIDPAIAAAPKVGSMIVSHRTLITTAPAVHAYQRNEFISHLNNRRKSDGETVLSSDEERAVHDQSVSLFFKDDTVLIRPELEAMALALEADHVLQSIIPKHRIRFLHARQPVVRNALRGLGELWRISEPPHTVPQMEEFIQKSLAAIGGRAIYRLNPTTGTRWLTLQQLKGLGDLSHTELLFHLEEIHRFAGAYGRAGHRELCCFAPGAHELAWPSAKDLATISETELRQLHHQLVQELIFQIPLDLRRDDLKNAIWRDEIFKVLTEEPDGASLCDVVDGLGESFRRQVQWLPGSRFQKGEMIFDPIFALGEGSNPDPTVRKLCDPAVKQFIPNFLREFGEIEHVNLGRLLPAQTSRPSGRRAVYVAEIKPKNSEERVVRIIRMHRWGIREHLNDGYDLLHAILKAHEYIHYVLDRRLACRQLGMNVPLRVACWDIPEDYWHSNGTVTEIWASYYERDYLHGTAANKISEEKLAIEEYALGLARLLGQAAAANLIVGRANENSREVVFDDGDELVLEDARGIPREMLICDHSRSFGNFRDPLEVLAGAYAQSVRSRMHAVPNPTQFAESYCQSLGERLSQIRSEYLNRKSAFQRLFENQPINEAGNFRFRWLKVLDRLEATNPDRIIQLIRLGST